MVPPPRVAGVSSWFEDTGVERAVVLTESYAIGTLARRVPGCLGRPGAGARSPQGAMVCGVKVGGRDLIKENFLRMVTLPVVSSWSTGVSSSVSLNAWGHSVIGSQYYFLRNALDTLDFMRRIESCT